MREEAREAAVGGGEAKRKRSGGRMGTLSFAALVHRRQSLSVCYVLLTIGWHAAVHTGHPGCVRPHRAVRNERTTDRRQPYSSARSFVVESSPRRTAMARPSRDRASRRRTDTRGECRCTHSPSLHDPASRFGRPHVLLMYSYSRTVAQSRHCPRGI
jgi:hypothetical protein